MLILRKKNLNRKIKERPKLYRMSRSLIEWFKLMVCIIVFFGGALGLYQFVAVSDFFKIQTISVSEPTAHLTKNQIIQLSGVSYGAHLLSLNLYEIESNLKRYSWIKDAKIKRNFPRGLILKVTEYEPVALILADDTYWLSVDGKIVAKAKESEGNAFPVITGFTKDQLEKYPGYFRNKVFDALNFLTLFQESRGVYPRVIDPTRNSEMKLKEIHYSLQEGITATIQNPSLQIYFGWGKTEEKIRLGEKIIQIMKDNVLPFTKVDLHIEGKIFAQK